MTNYEVVACCTFVLLVAHRREHLAGSAVTALIWPVLIPMLLYFGTKRFVFKRGPSEKYGELEVLGNMAVAVVGFMVYLIHTGKLH